MFIWLDLCATVMPIFIYRPELDRAYFRWFYRLYMIIISKSVLELTAILCHIVSSIELLLFISNKQRPKPLRKVPSIALFMLFISIFIYSYMFFVSYIDLEPFNTNATNKTSFQYVGYKISNTEFSYSLTKKSTEIAAFLIRDGVNFIVLVVLNVLIYLKVKKAMAKKKAILNKNYLPNTSTSNTNEAPSNGNSKMKRSERKTAFMVIIVSLCYIIGIIPIMISFVIRNLYDETNEMRIFLIASVVCIILSYDSYFFIYYFTNKNFKKLLIQFFFSTNIIK